MSSPAVPGLLLCFIAMVLLVFVSVSSPTWEKISFLDVSTTGRTIHFGVFGFTGSKHSVGYTVDPALFGLPNSTFDDDLINKLTIVLILHPIAGGLSALAVLFGLCGAAYSRAGTILMTLAATLATIVTLGAWIIDMILFTIARNRIRSEASQLSQIDVVTAQYGNAIWLTLGALISLFLAFCAGSIGSCGRYTRSERWRSSSKI